MVTVEESLMELVAETSSRLTARLNDGAANERKEIHISGAARVANRYTSSRVFCSTKWPRVDSEYCSSVKM